MRMIATRLAVASAVLFAPPALAQQADQGSGAGRREPALQDAPVGATPSRDHPPMFDPRRYTEDYRYLADQTQRSGAWWEGPKYLPLDDEGAVVLTLGGEVRVRGEAYENNLFSLSKNGDQAYVWERVLPYADLHLGQHVRLFGQIEAAYSQGQKPGPSPLDETRTDLLQGFVELTTPIGHGDLSARIGRQIISYGDGSLIDSRYGPNVLQSFDGAFLDYRSGPWRADVFWARPVRNGLRDFDDATDRGQQVWGAILGKDLPGLSNGVLDVYYFGFENDDASFNGKNGRERRHTIGLRHVGGLGPLDWKSELIGQFGSFGTGQIRAYAAAGEVGYTIKSLAFTPRLHLNGGVASGDRYPDDRNLNTFNALFPRGQYFSDTGLIGPYNLVNTRVGSQFSIAPNLRLDALVGFYWRASLNDGVYRNGGGPLFAGSAGEGRFVATQYEAVLDYSVTRGVDFRLTIADFEPGQFVRSTGNFGPVHFVGAETRIWF